MFHNYYNIPKLKMDPLPAALKTKLCCPFYGLYFRRELDFNIYRISHIRDNTASAIFLSPFPCLTYRNEQDGDGEQNIIINKYSA